MKLKFFALMLLVLVSIEAQAWKGMGGGGGSTSSGTTLDLEEAKNLTPISRTELADLVVTTIPNRLVELPQLKYLLSLAIRTKYWNLSAVALNSECESTRLGSDSSEIVGCQSSFEVRILQKWWMKASKRDRAAIVLHEALLAYFENTPYDSDLVRPIVAALLSNKPVAQVREAFRMSKFGFLATTQDVRDVGSLIGKSSAQLCRDGKLGPVTPWIAGLHAYMNPIIHRVRNSMAVLYSALGKEDFCAKPPDAGEAWSLAYWMQDNPLHLWWLDRDGVGDRASFRTWTLLQPL